MLLLLSKFRQPEFFHVVAVRSLFTVSSALTPPRADTYVRRSQSDSSFSTNMEHIGEGGKHRQGTVLQRAQLIDILSQKHDLSKTQATQILKTVFDTIVEVCELVKGKIV